MQSVPVIRFGVFEVDLRSGELRKNGLRIKLQDQPFQILTMLIKEPGQVVTREQPRQRLWPDGTFVDFEHGLHAAIQRLRQALNDSADTPRFIETLPKRGYRFLAPVTDMSVGAPSNNRGHSAMSRHFEPNALPERPGRVVGGLPKRVPMLVVSCLALLAGVALGMRFSRTVSNPPLQAKPMTGLPGLESWPAFSPDGKEMAFSCKRDIEGHTDLYIKLVETGPPRHLTVSPTADDCPAWSPDGQYSAFLRHDQAKKDVYVIPALGGPERKIASTDPRARGLSWSPDGQFLVTAGASSQSIRKHIFTVSLNSLEQRQLSFPPLEMEDDSPRFAPDGRSVAFVRFTQGNDGRGDIYLQKFGAAAPQRITHLEREILGLDWTPDGRDLIFSADNGQFNLWRVPSRGGEPIPINTFGNAALPAVSRHGSQLAYTQASIDLDIFRVELEAGRPTEPQRFVSSLRLDYQPVFSRDGSVAFISDRSGNPEVWKCGRDGSDCIAITSFDGPQVEHPQWSPDGQQLAFDITRGKKHAVTLAGLQGAIPRQLTDGTSNDLRPSWSRDGRSLYFASDRSGSYQIWKASVDGTTPIQVTHNGGFEAQESADGYIYYTRSDTSGIWRVSINGGVETRVPDQGEEGHWAILDHRIYLLNPSLVFFDLSNRRWSKLLAPSPSVSLNDLTVSVDNRWIAFTQKQGSVNIMLVKNFR